MSTAAQDPIEILADFIDAASPHHGHHPDAIAKARKALTALTSRLDRATVTTALAEEAIKDTWAGAPSDAQTPAVVFACQEYAAAERAIADETGEDFDHEGYAFSDTVRRLARHWAETNSQDSEENTTSPEEHDAGSEAPHEPPEGWRWIDGVLVHRDGRVATIGDHGLSCFRRGGWSDSHETVPMEIARYLLAWRDATETPRPFCGEPEPMATSRAALAISGLSQSGVPCLIAGDVRTHTIDAVKALGWSWEPARSRLTCGPVSIAVAFGAPESIRGMTIGAAWLVGGSVELHETVRRCLRVKPQRLIVDTGPWPCPDCDGTGWASESNPGTGQGWRDEQVAVPCPRGCPDAE